MTLIRVEKNSLYVSATLLGTPCAWAWVGFGWSPTDDNDERVLETRRVMEKFYPYIPYGVFVGNRGSDGSMVPIEQDESGYYRLDLSWWQPGAYRMNFHTEDGVPSPVGSPLRLSLRDKNFSWMPLERIMNGESESDKIFLHKEENNAGYSIRILIWPDRSVSAFGDLARSPQ